MNLTETSIYLFFILDDISRVVPYKHDRACDPLVVGLLISPRHKQDTFSADQFKCTISRAGAGVDLF